MKTTLELPDDLLRRSKATAALRGESLKEFVATALLEYLEREAAQPVQPSWLKVFGQAKASEVREIDAIIDRDFGRINPGNWT